jgi:DNA-binding NtrC family response regulator
VIASALPGLRDQVARGDFREDLFYGLAAVLLEVPPLRRRRDDIPLLAYHFLGRLAKREGKDIRRISGEALTALRRHAFPGNVGELERAIEHAVVMARGRVIQTADLPLGNGEADDDQDRAPSEGVAFAEGEVMDLPYAEAKVRAVATFDQVYVTRCLEQAGGNVSEAARLAGLDRSNFRRLLKRMKGTEESSA